MREFLLLMVGLFIVGINVDASSDRAPDREFAAAGALAKAPGDIVHGYSVAEQACAKCHAVDPSKPHSPNSAAPAFPAIAAAPGLTPSAIRAWLQMPHPAMPDVKLTDVQKNDIAAYLLSLETA